MTLFVERRRPALTPDLLVRVALAWAMICALLLVTTLSAMIGQRFPDPDDTLRLVQVRDLLAGQGWFDLAQHRAGATPMHWSRLVDLPIAAVILAVGTFASAPAAEMTALIVVPLLTLFACLFLVGRVAWRILGDELAVFACLSFAFCVPVIEQLRPMRIDHHGWQIAAVLLALNGLMARSPRAGGWLVGGGLALALAISLEGLPIAAVFMGVLALRWLRSRADRQWLVSAMQSLALVSLALHGATRGLDLAANCDAVGPVHLAMFAGGAVVLTITAAREPRPRGAALTGFALAAGGALGILLLATPQCANGAFAALDPLSRAMWYDRIREGMPIWQQSLPVVLQTLLPPVIALAATFRLAGRASGWLRCWWIDYAILLGAALAVSVFVARAGAVAGALAAIPLGWQLREWLRGARHLKRPLKKAMIYGGISVALVPAAPALLLVSAVPGQAQLSSGNGRPPPPGRCGLSSRPVTLAALPAGTVLAPLDVAPQILLATRHSVLATGHHRAPRMAAVIAAFLAPPAEARAIALRNGVDYVALCPDVAEPQNYAHDAPRGLSARLLAGDPPAWLEPVPRRGDDGWQVWRMRPAG
ncbi:MAG: hypothetical protein ACEQR8_04350 [Cypionkella sp.]